MSGPKLMHITNDPKVIERINNRLNTIGKQNYFSIQIQSINTDIQNEISWVKNYVTETINKTVIQQDKTEYLHNSLLNIQNNYLAKLNSLLLSKAIIDENSSAEINNIIVSIIKELPRVKRELMRDILDKIDLIKKNLQKEEYEKQLKIQKEKINEYNNEESAAENRSPKDEVIIVEKKNMLGKKLLITGKGRCNITSSLEMEDFIKNTPGNGMFLYSSFQQFTNKDIINFLKKQGLEVKEERGSRIFPITDKSTDVLNCFINRLKELKVKIYLNENVEQIITQKTEEEQKVIGIKTNKRKIEADKVILATGGKSYPLTGSTGEGYKMAKDLGHTITEIKPSLVPLETYEVEKELQGLSLKNVKIQLKDTSKKRIIYEDFGEMIFTHFGVSGPTILSSSAHLVRYKNIENLFKERKIILKIDLKPALSEEKLNDRILRDFEEEKNKQFKNSLNKLLPQKMINSVIKKSKIDPQKQVNTITKQERTRLIEVLKGFELEIKKFRPIEEAIITSGGIKIKEINPKTMESKKVKGLYFAGEIIDVDSYTGGFNLQIAYSTGYVAGKTKI